LWDDPFCDLLVYLNTVLAVSRHARNQPGRKLHKIIQQKFLVNLVKFAVITLNLGHQVIIYKKWTFPGRAFHENTGRAFGNILDYMRGVAVLTEGVQTA
jgi:hypothetical protein